MGNQLFQGVCESDAKQDQRSCTYVYFSGNRVPQFTSRTQKAHDSKQVKNQQSNNSLILMAKWMRPKVVKWSNEILYTIRSPTTKVNRTPENEQTHPKG